MRSTLRNAVVLIAVIACGCKDEDDDDWMDAFDSSVLPSFDAGLDGGRSDAGGSDAAALDASVLMDTGVAPADTGTAPGQDATTPADAAAGDASAASEGGAGDAGAGDASMDASPSDAGGDARVGDAGNDAGPRDAGRDGAAGDARVDGGTPTTFTRVLTILRSNCGSCHTTRSEAQLNFSANADVVYDDLVGVRATNAGVCSGDPERIRVIPDDPENSLLIQKLVDPPCGDRMPRFRDPLSPALIGEIRSWIADGAPEN